MKMIKIKEISIRQHSFIFIFITTLYVVCNIINFDKISKWFLVGNEIDFIPLFAYFVLGWALSIVVFTLLAQRWIIKGFSIFLLLSSTAAAYFISKYDVAVDKSMIMNVLYTDPKEISGLLSIQMLPYIIFMALIPTLLIIKVKIVYKKPLRHLFDSIIIIGVSLVLAISLLYMNFSKISQAVNVSSRYAVHSLVPINVVRGTFSILSRAISPYFKGPEKPIELSGTITQKDDLVVVLAIGETSRQQNFSLYGYSKNTNPLLSKYDDIHILNGEAVVASTIYAIPKILKKNDVKLPAMTNKVGIDTSCYVNFQLYGNCDPIPEIKVSNCAHDGNCFDGDVVPLLEKNLESYKSGYRFVVLHLGGGSHGPLYSERIPPEFEIFKPACKDADVVNKCSKEELYNAFDNTILYVDHVVNEIIVKLENSKTPYVLIYLSDHGESLLEDGRIFHGMPPGIPLPEGQSHIPLIIKSSIPIEIEDRESYTQQDVYDSVINLFSIESSNYENNNGFINKAASKVIKDKK